MGGAAGPRPAVVGGRRHLAAAHTAGTEGTRPSLRTQSQRSPASVTLLCVTLGPLSRCPPAQKERSDRGRAPPKGGAPPVTTFRKRVAEGNPLCVTVAPYRRATVAETQLRAGSPRTGGPQTGSRRQPAVRHGDCVSCYHSKHLKGGPVQITVLPQHTVLPSGGNGARRPMVDAPLGASFCERCAHYYSNDPNLSPKGFHFGVACAQSGP
jgi:hypothetical protein